MAKKQTDIESLFRDSLDDLQVQPSPKAWKRLSRQLFWKDFTVFDPGRFNIYYALVIAAALAAAVILASSTNRDNKPVYPRDIQTPQDETHQSVIPLDSSAEKNMEENKQEEITGPVSVSGKEEEKAGTRQPGNVQSERKISTGKTTSDEPDILPEKTGNSASIDDLRPETEGNTPGKSQVFIMPLTMFEPSSRLGCAPLTVVFSNYSINGSRYEWTFGDGSLSYDKSPEHTFGKAGEYLVTLTVAADNHMLSALTRTITVLPRPVAKFDIESYGKPGSGDPAYFYNRSEGAGKFEWHFGDGGMSHDKDPVWYYKEPGNYDIMLIARNEAGCVDTTVMKDAFGGSGPEILFPNVFTPDLNGPGGGFYSRGESNHDVFHPYTIEVPEEYELKIYNRLGILVFESHDIHRGWDGYYQDRLQPAGVYVWKAKGRFANGEPFEKMGDVTLIYQDVR